MYLFREKCRRVFYSICRRMSDDKTSSKFTMENISRQNFIPLEEVVHLRQKESSKSVLIEVPQKRNVSTLQSLCLEFGQIKHMFGFKSFIGKSRWMTLVEFEEEDALNNLIKRVYGQPNQEFNSLPISLPFLQLRSEKDLLSLDLSPELKVPIHFEKKLSQESIIEHMRHECQTMSEQIQYFYDQQKMTEISWRLRFMTCRKIEWALPKVFSRARVLPFGSSVSTFGNWNCDLDMVVDFAPDSDALGNQNNFPLGIPSREGDGDLRDEVRHNLELMAELMSFYLPGFHQVVKIFNAKVPIIKCTEAFTGLECDISMGNKSGFYMSELLYLYGCYDARVRPLVFCVRWWAKEKKLTRKNEPGRWFSNFTSTMLVLFFLMNQKPSPVVPPLSLLQKLSDKSFSSGGIVYSFVRHVSRIPASENSDSLEELLEGFFEFYAAFDFKKQAISVITGNTFPKPNFSPLYIQNPVENELNVSRHVAKHELEAFKRECLVAAAACHKKQPTAKSSSDLWGLLAVIANRSETEVGSKRKKRLSFDVDISSLFEKNQREEPTFTQKSDEAAKNKQKNIDINFAAALTSKRKVRR